jgi:hypothetical protein
MKDTSIESIKDLDFEEKQDPKLIPQKQIISSRSIIRDDFLKKSFIINPNNKHPNVSVKNKVVNDLAIQSFQNRP